MLKLLLEQEIDSVARENFQKIEQYVRETPVLAGEFKFISFKFTGTATNLKLKHGLGFTPRDLLQTSLIGGGTVTWNMGLFDANSLDVTITGTVTPTNPTTVRLLLGNLGTL